MATRDVVMSLRNCSCVVAVIVIALMVLDGTRLHSRAILSNEATICGWRVQVVMAELTRTITLLRPFHTSRQTTLKAYCSRDNSRLSVIVVSNFTYTTFLLCSDHTNRQISLPLSRW